MFNRFIYQSIFDWYQLHGRQDLPWRLTHDAYAIYVSEIMLQQTQVKTVLERFYHPFMGRFPSLIELADASLEEVLQLWQGLGYYSRAKNLHRAAQISAPHLPESVEELMALPGIGKNTAHAIAAFAYGKPVPVMEANLRRVISRVLALKNANDKTLWDYAESMVNVEDPFTYNQAMMDIGALVCTAKNPSCDQCPLSQICRAKHNPTAYPAPKVKKKTPVKEVDITIWRKKDSVWLAPRTSNFLHGLYGFYEQERGKAQGIYLGDVRQIYSHFTVSGKVYVSDAPFSGDHGGWYRLDAFDGLPMSGVDKKVVKLLIGADEVRGQN